LAWRTTNYTADAGFKKASRVKTSNIDLMNFSCSAKTRMAADICSERFTVGFFDLDARNNIEACAEKAEIKTARSREKAERRNTSRSE